jgi:phosphate transport system substrate-binding protein
MTMFSKVFPAVALCALALTACGDTSGGTRESVRSVGSSTVQPFAKGVAEAFVRSNPQFASPIIEGNGTGAGMNLFCAGVGYDHPDIVNASRRMKLSEFEECRANGVTGITEIQIGLDGLALASAKDGIKLPLTSEMVYRALAAKPFGKEQTAKTWKDVDPSLPADPILVYGPPTSSGTRDSFEELIMLAGCKDNPEMKALKESNEDEFDKVCNDIRTDGPYVDSGENDNLIVKKLQANPRSVGVFGYSYLEENLDKLHGLTMNGIEPTYDTISTASYPGARQMYIYVKLDHLDTIKGLREFVAEWAKSWGKDGSLAAIGLVVNPDDVMAKSASAAAEFPLLTADELK